MTPMKKMFSGKAIRIRKSEFDREEGKATVPGREVLRAHFCLLRHIIRMTR